jgi:alpha-glucosidase (family GH31 glycosyl hydrolase)
MDLYLVSINKNYFITLPEKGDSLWTMWIFTMEFMWEPTMHSVALYGPGGRWWYFFHGKEISGTLDGSCMLNFVERVDAREQSHGDGFKYAFY